MISLVIGLGNIGAEYDQTRHNVGFEILDRALTRLRAEPLATAEEYMAWRGQSENGPVVLAKPRTYMNRSGTAVRALLERFDLAPEEILVLVDDFNLPLGAVRIRTGGSDGGHNGLASIITALGTERFPRLRLGIGEPPAGADVSAYVLSPFTAEEQETIAAACEIAAEAVQAACEKPLDIVMSRYNRNPASPENDRPGEADDVKPNDHREV